MALGFIVGLRAQSKIVRIIAPLVGYLAAALGHMVFNFFASVGLDDTVMAIIGWAIALSLIIYLIRRDPGRGASTARPPRRLCGHGMASAQRRGAVHPAAHPLGLLLHLLDVWLAGDVRDPADPAP